MIELWHGGSRWVGDPEIRPGKATRREAGPGIYFTTKYETARKYAKGGKVTTRVQLADNVRWLEQKHLPLQMLVDYLKSAPRLPNRRSMLDYLIERYSDGPVAMDTPCRVERLVNLMVNHDALLGNRSIHLANWLVSNGVDASLYNARTGEQWVIVFNPAVIKNHRVVSAADVSLADYELPAITLPK